MSLQGETWRIIGHTITIHLHTKSPFTTNVHVSKNLIIKGIIITSSYLNQRLNV